VIGVRKPDDRTNIPNVFHRTSQKFQVFKIGEKFVPPGVRSTDIMNMVAEFIRRQSRRISPLRSIDTTTYQPENFRSRMIAQQNQLIRIRRFKGKEHNIIYGTENRPQPVHSPGNSLHRAGEKILPPPPDPGLSYPIHPGAEFNQIDDVGLYGQGDAKVGIKATYVFKTTGKQDDVADIVGSQD